MWRVAPRFILGEDTKVLLAVGPVARLGHQRLGALHVRDRSRRRHALARSLLPEQVGLPVGGVIQVELGRVRRAPARHRQLLSSRRAAAAAGEGHAGAGLVGDGKVLPVNVLQAEELAPGWTGEAARVEGDLGAADLETRLGLEVFQ